MKKYDVIIIGAGAAGLSAASAAIENNKSVLILESGDTPARKVMTSGGGRCNFTNTAAAAQTYFGENPNFVRSALAQVKPAHIIEWVKAHNLKYCEKNAGQYFCATGAKDIVAALIYDAANAHINYNSENIEITKQQSVFVIKCNNASYESDSLIIATGGTSFPALGVSDFGCKIAKQFGHKIIPVRPALCAISTDLFSDTLAGLSLMCEIKTGQQIIKDSLLFTHFGIGGPAVYRATVRDFSDNIRINLLPNINAFDLLKSAKQTNGKKSASTILSTVLPQKLAKWICNRDKKNIADYKDSEIREIADNINNIVLKADDFKLHGMQSAEVVRGGVSTELISSKTMESKLCAKLFFAGEVMDIAGDLGGFNLQWAWSSGRVAGKNA